jgi:hypothetical protein
MASPVPHFDYVCTCEEGEYCPPCFAVEAAYWGRYFGQDRGTPEQRRATLEAMDPRPASAEQMAEWRALK